MVNEPLISIIIPTFNNSSEVCQAIDCSLAQTYRNKEVIVVDDGSTDGTEQLLAGTYGKRITYIRQDNRGTGAARNVGIRRAAGTYLQFLDADDLIDHEKISIQMAQLRGSAGPALSYCTYSCCDMNNVPVPAVPCSPRLNPRDPFYDIMMKWETEVSIPIHCFIFDAALFKGHGISFNECLAANEDWECWMSIFALQPTVMFTDRVLASYRMRQNSRASNRLAMRTSYLEAINHQAAAFHDYPEISRNLALRRRQIKYFYRDAGLVMRVLKRFPPLIRKLYVNTVPWRVQRLLD